ncbi:MAG: lactate utilization protein [Treponema sp.]|nr:lactate utilization protein [Spirochaetia bacterium]MDD7458300.1 lactate utilization protein [Spirochaetales bacterium]MDY5811394.1 lactate utilization protein [Treponema sp.]MEE1180876.1 lactate utilization protein [Treponema sp.]
MNQHKKTFYRIQAENIITKMKPRGMEGYYCDTIDEAKKKVLELLGSGAKSVGYGGSMTIDDCGLKNDIIAAGHNLIKREELPAEEANARNINADFFLMSSNAITLNGELVNIDKRGNRICFLIYGPKNVIIIAGMNKIAANVEDAVRRVRSEATPPNAIRLNMNTPCSKFGRCVDCLGSDSLCANIVTTRTSCPPGRIKVILVGEELGY